MKGFRENVIKLGLLFYMYWYIVFFYKYHYGTLYKQKLEISELEAPGQMKF